MKRDMERFVREREQWGALVGRFILSFGDIENVTYLALFHLPKDKIFETTSTLGFGKRVDLVIELVTGHREIGEDLVKKFTEKLKAANQLSVTRNIVAHSPLMMRVYEHEKEGWVHQEMALANVRNRGQAISLEKLTEAAQQAGALADDLYNIYSEIHKRAAKNA